MISSKFVINALIFVGTATAERNTFTGGIQDMLPHMFASLDSQSLTKWNFGTTQPHSFWFYDTECTLNNSAESCSAHAEIVYSRNDFVTQGDVVELTGIDTYDFQAYQIPLSTVNFWTAETDGSSPVAATDVSGYSIVGITKNDWNKELSVRAGVLSFAGSSPLMRDTVKVLELETGPVVSQPWANGGAFTGSFTYGLGVLDADPFDSLTPRI
jgi:hypothetical protein